MSHVPYHVWRRLGSPESSRITHNGEKVYIDGKLAYDGEQEEETVLLPEEVEAKIKLYSSALEELAGEHRKYHSNYNLWQRWEKPMRLWWIEQIEGQAQAGKQTIGVEVVSRAVEIRLTRS